MGLIERENMKNPCVFLALLLAAPLFAYAQNLELSGGYAHISGDGGLDGFNVGAAWRMGNRVSLAFDYDSAWDTSRLGVFELTQTGLIVSKSHLQDVLFGPRVSFAGVLKDKKTFVPRLWPFAEAQFGYSHLNSSLEDKATSVTQSASDNGFSWMVGGGADYRFASHWMGRFKVDFLRTHFADEGQSRLRLSLGIAYTFGERGAKEAAEAKRKADAELAAAEAQKKTMEQARCEECKKQAREELEEKIASKEAAEAQRKADAELAATEAQKKTMEQVDREKQAVRARLLEQFNRVLPTTDTPRGLVVNMGDVLFDAGKSNLRPQAREALAKLSGVVLNYPSLRLTIEGHTDNTGSAEINQTISERRANAVRNYLVQQGLDASSLSAQGLGTSNPVADNGTAEGRQKNRRVEIIVSGEVIGTQIGH
jgi:outer membrane protein OmpA-like peptidoglycan-associated protein/opacity protein-like surface antigen